MLVVGACGGVGASTLAALLARRRSGRGGRVVLVDLDRTRGGIEVVLGLESTPGARWADFDAVRSDFDPTELDGVLPTWGRVEVLSSGRSGSPVGVESAAAVAHALVSKCSTVVVDVPASMLVSWPADRPAPSDPFLARREDLLLVTGQDVRGVAGVLAMRDALDGPAGLVLRRRKGRQVAPAEVVHLLDLPLVGLLPTDRRLADATNRGLGPVVGWRLSRAVETVAAGAGRGERRRARGREHLRGREHPRGDR